VEPRQLEYFVTVAEESQAGNVPVWETVTVASDPTSATASAVPRSRAAGAVKVVTGAVVRTGMSAESLTGRSGLRVTSTVVPSARARLITGASPKSLNAPATSLTTPAGTLASVSVVAQYEAGRAASLPSSC
jgi:hypothetical protein